MNKIQVIQERFADLEKTTFADLFGERANLHLKQELSYFMQILAGQNGGKLLQCDPDSIMDSIRACVVMGLSLNPIKQQAYLIPYSQRCTLRISYRGEIDFLAARRVISRAVTGVVYEKDTFHMEQGVSGTEYQYIKFRNGNRGKLQGAFCVFHLPDGGTHGDFITLDDLSLRQRMAKKDSTGGNNFWDNFPDEMRRKTALHYAIKGLPMNDAIAELTEVEHAHLNLVNVSPAEISDERAKQLNEMFEFTTSKRELDKVYNDLPEAERIAPRTNKYYGLHTERIRNQKQIEETV